MSTLRWLFALSALNLAGCSPVSVQDYSGQTPEFVPEQFFDGSLVAHGVIKNRGGAVTRRFVADIRASWENGVGTLDETFEFDDGSTDKRIWTLESAGEGRYLGTAGDVVGPGKLTLAGNTLFLDYVLRVPWRDGSIDLRIDDRMYLIDENTLINESVMYKFGLRVGEILLVIRRLQE